MVHLHSLVLAASSQYFSSLGKVRERNDFVNIRNTNRQKYQREGRMPGEKSLHCIVIVHHLIKGGETGFFCLFSGKFSCNFFIKPSGDLNLISNTTQDILTSLLYITVYSYTNANTKTQGMHKTSPAHTKVRIKHCRNCSKLETRVEFRKLFKYMNSKTSLKNTIGSLLTIMKTCPYIEQNTRLV